jgi:hypothetical protein
LREVRRVWSGISPPLVFVMVFLLVNIGVA